MASVAIRMLNSIILMVFLRRPKFHVGFQCSYYIDLAHGEVDITSLKSIYTNHESESAITHPELLFGSGEVAILFICNSRVANDDIFSKAVLSLCHDILKLVYKRQ